MKQIAKKITVIITAILIFAAFFGSISQAEKAEIVAENFSEGGFLNSSQSASVQNKELVLQIPKGDSSYSYVSSELSVTNKTLKPNALGLTWKQKGAAAGFMVRVFNGHEWSYWYDIPTSEDLNEGAKAGRDGYILLMSDPLILDEIEHISKIQYQATLIKGKTAPKIKNVKLIAIDATKGPNPSRLSLFKRLFGWVSADPLTPTIISREQWGADPKLMTWDPEYAPNVDKLIIHHTASSNTNSNPAATVRAIYYFHSVTRDWGDIGYNFLIDRGGAIYEGRYGGDKVVGAHARRFNYGSAGISLLGTYSNELPTEATLNSLSQTLGYLGFKYNFAKDSFIRSVGGHRDFNSTECPGQNLYDYMSTIKQNGQDYFYKFLAARLKAELVGTISDPAALDPDGSATVTLVFKNTGLLAWDKSGATPTFLRIKKSESSGQLKTDAWVSDNKIKMEESHVEPGEAATFKIPFLVPEYLLAKTYAEKFQLYASRMGWYGPENDIHVTVKPNLGATFISAESLKLKLNEKKVSVIKVINESNVIWQKGKTILVSDDNHFTQTARIAKSTNPGQVAIFKLKIIAVNTLNAGDYLPNFSILFDGQKIEKTEIPVSIQVSPRIIIRPTQTIKTLSLPKNDRREINLRFKNAGNTVLSAADTSLKMIGGLSSLVSAQIIVANSDVKPNEVIKFPLTFFSKNLNKDYTLAFVAKSGSHTSSTIRVKLYIVKAVYKSAIIKGGEALTLSQGEKKQVTVTVKNTGNVTWGARHSYYLKTGKTQLADSDDLHWKNSARVISDVKLLAPGKQVDFIFSFVALGIAGKYNKCFKLAIDSVIVFPKKACFDITVLAVDYFAISSTTIINDQETTSVSLKPNTSARVSILLNNVGNATWYGEGSAKPTRLATVNPKNHHSVFKNSTWLKANRIAIVNAPVKTNEKGIFNFEIAVSNSMLAGIYHESLQLAIGGIGLVGPVIDLTITVESVYLASFVSQSVTSLSLSPNDVKKTTFVYKNTGNVTWNSVKLASDLDYISSDVEGSVAPGTQATFTAAIKPATDVLAGEQKANIQLQVDDQKFGDIASLSITILAYYEGEIVGQTTPKIFAKPNKKYTVTLTYKNTGNATWYDTSLVTRLTDGHESRFYDSADSSWMNNHEIKGSTDTVKVGEEVSFRYKLKVGDWQTGIYTDNFSPSIRGNYNLPNAKYTVGIIRNAIKVSGNGAFTAYSSKDVKIKDFNKDNLVAVGYRNKNYYIGSTDYIKSISSYVRFVPEQDTILSFPSYADTSSWDSSINDNIFRGVLEVHYSTKSNILWAIDELPLADYLKGIAETGPTAPYEHIKVMSVIARTYALWHVNRGGKHLGEPFHLKNSRKGNGNDQVYKGYGLEKRFSKQAQAVTETKDQVVTYQNELAVTPYFSCSDGRTRSAAEVGWYSGWPWLISVSDPYGGGCTVGVNGNHGVGLSGKGSVGYAAIGKLYDWIIKHYYTGTEVSETGDDAKLIRVSIYGKQY